MVKEVIDWKSNDNYDVVLTSEISSGATVIPSVWQTRHKKDIITIKIKSYKAILNLYGSRMVKGRDCDQTYAPVVSWNAIRLVLTMLFVHNWKTIKLEYVQEFPQAPTERELSMDIPKGFDVEESDNRRYALRLKANVYGQKQAG